MISLKHIAVAFVFGSIFQSEAFGQQQQKSGALNSVQEDQIEVVNVTNQTVVFTILSGDTSANYSLRAATNDTYPVDKKTGKSTLLIKTNDSLPDRYEVEDGVRYKIELNAGAGKLVVEEIK